MRTTFFKTEITDRLTPSIQTVNEVLDIFNKADIKNIGKNTPYVIINRNEQLKDAIKTINTPSKRVLLINGFYGVGKTEFVKTLFYCLDSSVLRFYYECSQVTNLDDIIVSLYSYLNMFFKKNTELARDLKVSPSLSVDRKVIEYIKNLKRPLIITIDSLEHLIDKNFTLTDSEVAKFLNYLMKFPNIKLIISSQKLLASGLNLTEQNTYRVKLGGIDESHSLQILKGNDVNAYDNILCQAYEITRGYPEGLFWFINGVKNLNITPFDLIGEYTSRKDSFEEYMMEKSCISISSDCIKLARFLAVLRHSVKIGLLQTLNVEGDLDKKIKTLKDLMIITENDGYYYIKPMIKSLIYKQMPLNEKNKIHNFLHEFYSNQIPKPIHERMITLSRKLLHTEQFYHFQITNKLKPNFNILASTPQQYYDYKASTSPAFKKIQQEIHKAPQSHDVEIESIFENDDEKSSHTDINFKKKLLETLHEMDDDDLGIELSEDERRLLIDDTNIDSSPEELKESSKLIIPIFFEEEQALKTQPIKISIEDQKNQLLQKANSYATNRKFDLAFSEYKKAWNLLKSLGEEADCIKISITIANLLTDMHKFEEATSYFNDAIKFYQNKNDFVAASRVSNMLASSLSESYKHDEALKVFKRVISEKKENVDNQILSEAYAGLGEIYDYRQNSELAINNYLQALKISDNKEQSASISFKLALVYDDNNNVNKALEYYKKCAEYDNLEQNIFLAESLANIAAIYQENNNFSNAKIYYLKSLEVDKFNKNFDGEYKTINKLANISISNGDNSKALEFLLIGIDSAKKSKDLYLIAGALFNAGEFYLSIKDYEKALKSFILSKKTIGSTISTDSSEKIDRKIRTIMSELGEVHFNIIMERLKRSKGH